MKRVIKPSRCVQSTTFSAHSSNNNSKAYRFAISIINRDKRLMDRLQSR